MCGARFQHHTQSMLIKHAQCVYKGTRLPIDNMHLIIYYNIFGRITDGARSRFGDRLKWIQRV